jgi:hypothetical protein
MSVRPSRRAAQEAESRISRNLQEAARTPTPAPQPSPIPDPETVEQQEKEQEEKPYIVDVDFLWFDINEGFNHHQKAAVHSSYLTSSGDLLNGAHATFEGNKGRLVKFVLRKPTGPHIIGFDPENMLTDTVRSHFERLKNWDNYNFRLYIVFVELGQTNDFVGAVTRGDFSFELREL